MKVKTKFFGELEISNYNCKVLKFRDGILGFPEDKEYVLFSHPENKESAFYFLQSTKNEWLCFVLINPYMFFKDYNPVFPWKELQDIEIVDKESMEIFCIVTIPPNEPQEMTVNLQAPVVINKNKLIAKQIIAINEYDIRHKLVS